jgi:hypothetical protein
LVLFRWAALLSVILVLSFQSRITEELINVWPHPKSSVDAVCGRLWVSHAQNDPALACYLTARTSRFCDPDERQNLRWIFWRYAADKRAFGQDMLYALASMDLRLIAVNSRDPSADAVQQINKAARDEAESLKKQDFQKVLEVDMISRSELVAMLQNLGARGLVSAADFGWWPDSLVGEAFQGLKPVLNACS